MSSRRINRQSPARPQLWHYNRYHHGGLDEVKPANNPLSRAFARRPPTVLLRFILTAVTLLTVAVCLHAQHVAAQELAQSQALADQAQKMILLQRRIKHVTALYPQVDFSISVASDTTSVHSFGTLEAQSGASTGKLLTAADYLHHVEEGKASLRQQFDGVTAQDWLERLIVNSDDTAWAELNTYLSHRDLQQYAARIGFTQYDPATNYFTSADLARLLQRLYSGTLLQSAHQKLLLGYMSRANYRDYLVPAAAGASVYHKIGINDDVVNDAAIFSRGDRWLVIVVLTNGHGTYLWHQRALAMQQIAQAARAVNL